MGLNDLRSVLKRRAKRLLQYSDNSDFAEAAFAMQKAAHQLSVHDEVMTDVDKATASAIAENKRLRDRLVDIDKTLSRLEMEKVPAPLRDVLFDVVRAGRNTLAAVPAFGVGRMILAVQVGDKTRLEIEEQIQGLLDDYFTRGEQTNDEETESAGRDATQREGAEQADRQGGEPHGDQDRAAEGAAREDRGCGSPVGTAD